MYAAQRRSVEPPAGSPFAFVFPAEQADPPTTRELLEVLETADVEIEVATADFTAGDRQYRAGSHVVRFAQPAALPGRMSTDMGNGFRLGGLDGS